MRASNLKDYKKLKASTPRFKPGDFYRLYDEVTKQWHSVKVLYPYDFSDECFVGTLDDEEETLIPKQVILDYWHKTQTKYKSRHER